jgi:hypothetical protein
LGYDTNEVYLYLTPNADDTSLQVNRNAAAIGAVIDNQISLLHLGLAHDCTVFDAHNICVSVGARNSSVSRGELSDQAALLVVGYRPNERTRVGVFADQSISDNSIGSVTQRHNAPTIGLFGNWERNADGNGLNIHTSAAFSSSDLSTNRSASATTEAAQGKTSLNAQAYEVRANYVNPLSTDLSVTPYLGLRYTHIAAGAYSETSASSLGWPVSYNEVAEDATWATAGASLSMRVTDKLSATASLGILQNLSFSAGTYSGTSNIGGLQTFSTPLNKASDTMGTASLGAYYNFTPKERLAVTAQWQQQTVYQQDNTALTVTLTMGF